MLKSEWDAESNEKLPHLIIPSKTAPFFPEFAEEDLPLGRTHVDNDSRQYPINFSGSIGS